MLNMLARTTKVPEHSDLSQEPTRTLPNFGKNQIHRNFDAGVCRCRDNQPHASVFARSCPQSLKYILHVFEIRLHHDRKTWVPQLILVFSELGNTILVENSEVILLRMLPRRLNVRAYLRYILM